MTKAHAITMTKAHAISPCHHHDGTLAEVELREWDEQAPVDSPCCVLSPAFPPGSHPACVWLVWTLRCLRCACERVNLSSIGTPLHSVWRSHSLPLSRHCRVLLGPSALDSTRMAAAWTLITGANRGIGFQLALDLIARSDRPLIIAARSQARQPAELWPARPTSNRCVGAAA